MTPAAQRLRFRVLVHRIPIATPVRTSFGVMTARPSVLIRVEDGDGHLGWGEVWCNFPAVGAEHRARLLVATVLPLAAQRGGFDDPARLWSDLTQRLRILGIQSGEPGPLAQCLAGLECALQDLAACRAGRPLWQHLAPDADPSVAVYASGINPQAAPETVRRAMDAGFAACKIKVGFDAGLDRENLAEARRILGPARALMADANQAWPLDAAIAFAATADAANLAWLEEPLAHDAPHRDWKRLAEAMATPLAAGENFGSRREFDALASRRSLAILQPDLGKWGGVGQTLAVAASARRRGLGFCPHWLGGGVGLLTSLHMKAAAGADSGYVEVDFNPNPMRSQLTAEVFAGLKDGRVRLSSERPGIGMTDAALDAFADALVLDASYVAGA